MIFSIQLDKSCVGFRCGGGKRYKCGTWQGYQGLSQTGMLCYEEIPIELMLRVFPLDGTLLCSANSQLAVINLILKKTCDLGKY